MKIPQYYKHLDSIEIFNEDEGEYGSFFYMDAKERVMKTHYILHYDERQSMEHLERPNVFTLSEYFDFEIARGYPYYLNDSIHSDFSFDMDELITLTIQEAIKCNTYLTDIEDHAGSFFSSSSIRKKIEKYVESLKSNS